MGRRVKVPISAARAKLFQLADLVRSSGEDAVVVLEQRGEPDRVALVREARLAYLEARVSELERRDRQPFKLAGSLASDLDEVSLDAALRAIRQEWTPREVTAMEEPGSVTGRRRPRRPAKRQGPRRSGSVPKRSGRVPKRSGRVPKQ